MSCTNFLFTRITFHKRWYAIQTRIEISPAKDFITLSLILFMNIEKKIFLIFKKIVLFFTIVHIV